MDKIVGTKEFLDIINHYKYEDLVMKRLFKNILTKNNEDNIREVLMERNKNVNKHEMEEDEAEKLTNVAANLNNPQKFRTVIMNLPEQQKRKIDRKEFLKFFNRTDEKEETTSNYFETSIKNDSSKVNLKTISYNNFLNKNLNSNKLETIYEKIKSETDPNNCKQNKNTKLIHYQRNLQINPPSNFYGENLEQNPNIKKLRVHSNYTYTDSVKTTCDSRLPSGIKSEKDPFISIINSPDLASMNKHIHTDFTLSPKNQRHMTGMEIIKNNLFNSPSFRNTNKSQISFLEQSFEKLLDSPKTKKILTEIEKQMNLLDFLDKIDKYEKNLVLNKNKGTRVFNEYRNSAYDIKKKYKYIIKNKFI